MNKRFLPDSSSKVSFIEIDKDTASMNLSSVPPNDCKQFTSVEYIDNCLDYHEINIGIGGRFQGSDDWCYDKDKVSIKTLKVPPTPSPKPPPRLCNAQVCQIMLPFSCRTVDLICDSYFRSFRILTIIMYVIKLLK